MIWTQMPLGKGYHFYFTLKVLVDFYINLCNILYCNSKIDHIFGYLNLVTETVNKQDRFF